MNQGRKRGRTDTNKSVRLLQYTTRGASKEDAAKQRDRIARKRDCIHAEVQRRNLVVGYFEAKDTSDDAKLPTGFKIIEVPKAVYEIMSNNSDTE